MIVLALLTSKVTAFIVYAIGAFATYKIFKTKKSK